MKDSSKKIFVVSAPSGAGKTTLNRRLLKAHSGIMMSVSYTARSPRPGEIDGVDYHYVSDAEFRKLIDADRMLEYATVFGNLYGTSLEEVDRIHSLGKDVLLEIDTQGFGWAKPKIPGAISIFIFPPSIEALWARLEERGTELREVRLRRLMTAKVEIETAHLYDYFIVNDDLDRAFQELQDIVIYGKKGKIDNAAGRAICKTMLAEYENSPLLRSLSAESAGKKPG